MKNILCIITALVSVAPIHAATKTSRLPNNPDNTLAPAPQPEIKLDNINSTIGERWAKASKERDWQFELKNKSSEPIYIQLVTGKSDNLKGEMDGNAVIPKKDMRVSTSITAATKKSDLDKYAGYVRFSNLNPRREWYLLIWSDADAKKAPGQMERDESPTYLYRIKLNRGRERIFLTWADNKLHSPGTTRLSTSASGVSLKDNVSNSDIVKEGRNNQFKYVG